MSIIYDALKKVEKNTSNSNNQQANSTFTKKPEIKKPNPLLVLILILLSLVFIAKTIIHIVKISKAAQPSLIPEPITIEPTVEITPQDKIEEPTLIEEPLEPELTLNGVYFQGNERYALINNRVVKPGDTIQNAKVKEINLEKVSLDFEGKVITLLNSSR
ncbi:MAG: hypothetical protein WAQ07_05065 [Candidatus Omnitrophota bacterium]